MAASGNLEGHGRPSVFLSGQVGQKYKDLDSGLEWVCKGERGFIKVDGDDQSEMYNWELVESGGSTGGGVFTVNVTQNEGGSTSSDKTYNEIITAIDSGLICQAKADALVMSLVAYSDLELVFASVQALAGTPTFTQVIITNDDTVQILNKGLSTM